jgi:hypothetical protein
MGFLSEMVKTLVELEAKSHLSSTQFVSNVLSTVKKTVDPPADVKKE